MGPMLKLKFSGNTSNGLSDSTFYLNVNNATSDVNVNISARNLSKTNISISPYQHGKTHYYTPLCVGRVIEDSGVTRL